MLKRAHRFHGHNSLRFVYQHGRTVRGPQIALKYAFNDRRETYRVAVVVSKKVNKSAVARNRIRRRLYEVVRHLEPRIKGANDIVITVFDGQVAVMPQDKLEHNIESQLKEAGLLARKSAPSE